MSGDLNLGVVGGATIEVRGLSTDVEATVPHRAEGTADRRRYIVGEGGAALSFRWMSGDILLRSPRRIDAEPERPADEARPKPAAASAPADAAQLAVLRALERGEIDVDEAARRLEATQRGQ